MSLGLHPDCQQRLIEKIADLLGDVKVKNGNVLVVDSYMGFFELDSVLPESGSTRDFLEQYIGETPTFRFMVDTLAKELEENLQYKSDAASTPLTNLEGYKDTRAIARRLVDDFESLPQEYSLTISFANDFGQLFAQIFDEYELGVSARILKHTDVFDEKFPHPLPRTLLGLSSPKEWNLAFAYFQVKVTGFISDWQNTAPIEQAVSVVKSFFGLGIAVRLYKINQKGHQNMPFNLDSYLTIHRRTSTEWRFEREAKLDASLAKTFQGLRLDDLEGRLDSDSKKTDWIINQLRLIKPAFEDNQQARKIMLASQWLLDSYSGVHTVFSFLQTAVVLEILLGDKARSDLMGLGELLGNRCAYLIANSYKEREYILKTFKDFYDVRSQIVHRGRTRLGFRETFLLFQLQKVCSRVIRKELELLEQN